MSPKENNRTLVANIIWLFQIFTVSVFVGLMLCLYGIAEDVGGSQAKLCMSLVMLYSIGKLKKERERKRTS